LKEKTSASAVEDAKHDPGVTDRLHARVVAGASFPVSKSLETYDFLAIPALNKKLVVIREQVATHSATESRREVGGEGGHGTGGRIRYADAKCADHERVHQMVQNSPLFGARLATP
jgi:hypothetical protein